MKVLTQLTSEAMVDIAHLLRPAHLQQLRNILDDPEASANDRFVALELLKNANVAAGMVLPGCQDTGMRLHVACDPQLCSPFRSVTARNGHCDRQAWAVRVDGWRRRGAPLSRRLRRVRKPCEED